MKKAKLILATVAVLGLVGGSLAFKAAKRSFTVYYYTYTPNTLATRSFINAGPDVAATTGTRVYWTTLPATTAPAANYNFLAADL